MVLSVNSPPVHSEISSSNVVVGIWVSETSRACTVFHIWLSTCGLSVSLLWLLQSSTCLSPLSTSLSHRSGSLSAPISASSLSTLSTHGVFCKLTLFARPCSLRTQSLRHFSLQLPRTRLWPKMVDDSHPHHPRYHHPALRFNFRRSGRYLGHVIRRFRQVRSYSETISIQMDDFYSTLRQHSIIRHKTLPSSACINIDPLSSF